MRTHAQVVTLLVATFLWRPGNSLTLDSSKPLRDPVVLANINTPSRFATSINSSPFVIDVGISGSRGGGRTISPFSTQLSPSISTQTETEEAVGRANDPSSTTSGDTGTSVGSAVEASRDNAARVSDSESNAAGSDFPPFADGIPPSIESPDLVDGSFKTALADAPTENESDGLGVPTAGVPLGSRGELQENSMSEQGGVPTEMPDDLSPSMTVLTPLDESADGISPETPFDADVSVSDEQRTDGKSPEELVDQEALVPQEKDSISPENLLSEEQQEDAQSPEELVDQEVVLSESQVNDSIIPETLLSDEQKKYAPSPETPGDSMVLVFEEHEKKTDDKDVVQALESDSFDKAARGVAAPPQDTERLTPSDSPSIPSTDGSLTPPKTVDSDAPAPEWSQEEKEQGEGQKVSTLRQAHAPAGSDSEEQVSTDEITATDSLARECDAAGCGSEEEQNLPTASPDSSENLLERDLGGGTNLQPLDEPSAFAPSYSHPPSSEPSGLSNQHQNEPPAESPSQGEEQEIASENLLDAGPAAHQSESDLIGKKTELDGSGTPTELPHSLESSNTQLDVFNIGSDAPNASELLLDGNANPEDASPPNPDVIPATFSRAPEINGAAEGMPAIESTGNNTVPESQEPVLPQHQIGPPVAIAAELLSSGGPPTVWNIAPSPSREFPDLENSEENNTTLEAAVLLDGVETPPPEETNELPREDAGSKNTAKSMPRERESKGLPPQESEAKSQPESSKQTTNKTKAQEEVDLVFSGDRTFDLNATEDKIDIVVASIDQGVDAFEGGALPPQESNPELEARGNADVTSECDDGSGRGPCKGRKKKPSPF
ncbi:hypothetical protein BSKO_01049 [Bryopsis sp. KO-2023]|nr:hypothetical protein BSKO_01049 [Bryopsis sp. KO-2023]